MAGLHHALAQHRGLAGKQLSGSHWTIGPLLGSLRLDRPNAGGSVMLRTYISLSLLGIALFGHDALGATLTLERVVSPSEIANPIQVAAPAGDTERLFVLDRQKGEIYIQDRETGTISTTPFFALPSSVFKQGVATQNAFSFAFDPEFSTTGKLYVSFINPDNDLQVIEVTMDIDLDPVDPPILKPILTVEYDPVTQGTHFGADLDFDADGYLYVTTGDSDADFEDVMSQDLSSLQGKILRIDPKIDAFESDLENNFTPAPGNPFSGPTTEVTDAIWALGLRNPFQASFDPVTDAYFIGDVGENLFEEINIGFSGANFGWPAMEGTIPGPVSDAAAYIDPLYAYGHGDDPFEGFSVTGGAVYRGPIAELDGRYFFSDYVTAQIWSFLPNLVDGSISELLLWSLISPNGLPTGVLSFGRDGSGNLYIVGEGAGGGVFRIASAAVDPVPIPAALPLFAAGLGAMGFLSWRRKRKGKALSF